MPTSPQPAAQRGRVAVAAIACVALILGGAFLYRSLLRRLPGVWPQRKAIALQIEFLRPHEDPLAVTGKDVRQRAGHVKRTFQRRLLSLTIQIVRRITRFDATRLGIQLDQIDAAIEERGPAGRTVNRPVLDKHAAMHGPGRFDSAIGNHATLARSNPGKQVARSSAANTDCIP